MRIIYIPFKKKILLNILIIVAAAFLMYFLIYGNTSAVLGYIVDNPIYKGNEAVPHIAFECNVVWGTEYIPAMLDIFKKYNIHITFFIGGEWAEDNPDLLKRIVNEGHEIGNHGYSHKHHSQLSFEQNLKEIKDAEDVIKEKINVTTSLFAPPYGEFNKTTLRAASSLGYKTIMWSIDTIDWRRDGIDNIIARVLKNPHNGAFVLMHPTEDTVTALPIIIEKLREQGYDICSISDLI